jgi:hypothetical protein
LLSERQAAKTWNLKKQRNIPKDMGGGGVLDREIVPPPFFCPESFKLELVISV